MELPLESVLQQRQALQNKGYTDEQMQTAALMVIADKLDNIDVNIGVIMDLAGDHNGAD